jgi:peptidoglycan/xylan/chitin deacetylase (PgdA/CDA1 family)
LPLKNTIRTNIVSLGWRLPFRNSLRCRPTVLTYHGVPRSGGAFNASDFEEHVSFLNQHFDVIGWSEWEQPQRAKPCVVLTFDDGLRNNAEVVAPILRRFELPAVFFVSSRHCLPGRYLWFVYLAALQRFFPGEKLQFRGECFNLSTRFRAESIARLRASLLALRPHPSAMYEAIEKELPPLSSFVSQSDLQDHCEGMSAEQVFDLSRDSLFTIGVHTVDHPFLTLCDLGEMRSQIAKNRAWLGEATGKHAEVIAYPGSDFDGPVVKECVDQGFRAAFSLERQMNFTEHMQIPRIGIYSPSCEELGFKVRWSSLVQAMNSRGFSPLTAS